MMKLKEWLEFEKQDLDKKIRHYPKFRVLLLLSFAFGCLVSLFWVWTKTSSLAVKDSDQLVIGVAAQLKTPPVESFFKGVTFLGSEVFVVLAIAVLALVLAIKGRKRAAFVALFSLLGSALFIYFFKNLFGRTRPSGCLDNGDCLAFPSGHTTAAVYYYGLLNYLVWRFLPVSLKTFLVICFFIVFTVLLIAVSRLVLGVHYLSDVLGGFFLGGTWLVLAIFLIDVLYAGTD